MLNKSTNYWIIETQRQNIFQNQLFIRSEFFGIDPGLMKMDLVWKKNILVSA